jgi:hypothetical protein
VIPFYLLGLRSFQFSVKVDAHLFTLDTVFRIRIFSIQKFLGLPDLDTIVRGTDPDWDLSIVEQK